MSSFVRRALNTHGRSNCAVLLSCWRLGRVVYTISTLLRVVKEGNDVPVAICKRLSIEEDVVLICLFARRGSPAPVDVCTNSIIRWLTSREKDHDHSEVLRNCSEADEALSAPRNLECHRDFHVDLPVEFGSLARRC